MMRCLHLALLILCLTPSLFSQLAKNERLRFNRFYVDSTGSKLDSLPVVDDSVFVVGAKYEFIRLTNEGKEKGLKAFDDQLLNLQLQIGVQEDRELGTATKVFDWFANFVARVATLSFWNLGWGENRYFFDKETFNEDLRRIQSLYEGRGYYGARIVKYRIEFSDDRKKLYAKIYIHEGKPTVLTDNPKIIIRSAQPIVDFKNNLNEKELLSGLPTLKGDPLDRDLIEVAKSSLQKKFNVQGYPFANVTEEIDTTGLGPRKAQVKYLIIPSRYVVFGKTDVSGNYYKGTNGAAADTSNKIVDDDVVLRKVRYKYGRPFNPDQLALTAGQINGLGVFRSAKPITNLQKSTLDSAKIFPKEVLDDVKNNSDNRLQIKGMDVRKFGVAVDTMHITMSVAERKEHSIKPGMGLTSDFQDLPSGANKLLPFTSFQVSWQSKNFFGGARKFLVSGQVSKGFDLKNSYFANYMEAKTTFRQPSLKLPLTADADNDLLVSLTFERNNTVAYDLVTYEASPSLIRQVTSQLSVTLTPFSFSQKRLLHVYATDSSNVQRNFFTTNTKFGATYNNSNDFFYPSSGWLIYFGSDFAGFILPSNLKYLKLNLDGRKYVTLTEKATLALRARAASAIPYFVKGKQTVIPVSEQFYGGGPNSVRSWGIKELGIPVESDSGQHLSFLGGNSILETSIELRYNLYVSRNPSDAVTGMDLAAFMDVGNVWTEYDFKNQPSDLPSKPVIAVGGGMRIRTLIGPVRVDIGYKLQPVTKLKVLDINNNVKTVTRGNNDLPSRLALQITLGQSF